MAVQFLQLFRWNRDGTNLRFFPHSKPRVKAPSLEQPLRQAPGAKTVTEIPTGGVKLSRDQMEPTGTLAGMSFLPGAIPEICKLMNKPVFSSTERIASTEKHHREISGISMDLHTVDCGLKQNGLWITSSFSYDTSVLARHMKGTTYINNNNNQQ